jgi:ribose/xylose/arabinose/galactoside ABC-type transport system permease subunit
MSKLTTQPMLLGRSLAKLDWRQYLTLFIFLGLCVVFHFLTLWKLGRPAFVSQVNIINVIRQVSIVGIMAVGMTYVIMVAEIDLGVGSLLAVCGMIAALLQRADAGLLASTLLPLLVGMATGLFVGLLVTYGRIPSFVATLGVLASYRGVALLISNRGQPVTGIDPSFRFIGAGVLGDVPGLASIPFIKVIPMPIVIFAIVIAVGAIVFQRYPFGRHVAAVGGNATAARLSGINVRGIKLAVFAISGVCAAISALILTSRLNMGSPLSGTTMELDVIAAVVVGGTSLYGGRGSVLGSILGAMLIGVLSNGLNLMAVNPHWQPVVKGVVIATAVLLDQLGRRHEE